jgi:DNA-binding LacI/PurR family transcriptional regulator
LPVLSTDAQKKHRITVNPILIIVTGLMIADRKRILHKQINAQNLPEAIFCVNDPTAIGVMKRLKQKGYKNLPMLPLLVLPKPEQQ